MIHLKRYKESKINPKFGDFVLLNIKGPDDEHFLSNHIGRIVSTTPNSRGKYAIQYKNIPEKIISWFSPFISGYYINISIDKISDIGTKEDMTIKLQAKKYNL